MEHCALRWMREHIPLVGQILRRDAKGHAVQQTFQTLVSGRWRRSPAAGPPVRLTEEVRQVGLGEEPEMGRVEGTLNLPPKAVTERYPEQGAVMPNIWHRRNQRRVRFGKSAQTTGHRPRVDQVLKDIGTDDEVKRLIDLAQCDFDGRRQDPIK